jgi:hypothetical protein
VDHAHDALTAEEVERLVAEDASARPNRSRSFGAKRNQRVEEALRARLQPLGHELMFRDDELFIDGEQVGWRLRRKLLGHHDSRDLLSDDDAFGRIIDRYLFVLVRRRAETQLELRARKLYLANRTDHRLTAPVTPATETGTHLRNAASTRVRVRGVLADLID